MITFQQEPPEPFAQQAIELFKKHYEEIGERQDVIKLDPDIVRYKQMYKNGSMEIHTVRDNDKLIGYSIWFISNHIHYQKSVTASSDVVYIVPDYRKGILGYKFIKWTTEKIKERNPQRIIFHIKPFLDFGKIVERIGGHYFEKTYTIVME
jgi:hypothetical protein